MDIDDRAAVPAQGYRWVHFDRADSDLEHWIADNVPELPGQALLQSQTRPRTWAICNAKQSGCIVT
ncbi:hypothetical protein [Ascidiaceihabitans sp.]|uniref:hypothetical protein n=1 Tax=Ascidiaceihabitans sp. TaxID=1872644 RepID=UPI003297B3C3